MCTELTELLLPFDLPPSSAKAFFRMFRRFGFDVSGLYGLFGYSGYSFSGVVARALMALVRLVLVACKQKRAAKAT
jgi:hypothetical protein